MGELSKHNLLRSWKEIAAYLGCDVRTCHRWEGQRGMPVHRAEASEKKSPVFAYKDELDAWFKGTFRSANGNAEKAQKIQQSRFWLKWALAGTTLVVLAGLLFRETGLWGGRQPADFRIEGSVLIVLNKAKHELWRFDTKLDDLLPESYYRKKFQIIHQESQNAFPVIAIKDLDGDGDKEVLFAPKRTTETADPGRLYCFDRKGTLRWPPFEAGRELLCGDKTFSPDYRVAGFVCRDLDGDGRLETLVFSYQSPDWPCQLAVLDSTGKMIGEYWNAGYLLYPAFHDLDDDGREELIVVGVNNEYRGGCLIVFDTRRISGGSPQSGKFACEGIGPGSELYYVTVPRTDVSEAEGIAVVGLNYVFVTKNDRISAWYDPALYYEFDFGLACRQVYTGHGYQIAHGELKREGMIASTLDDAYLRKLLDGVRWWNGSEWTAEPSANTAAAAKASDR
jgi:hypothetical protein